MWLELAANGGLAYGPDEIFGCLDWIKTAASNGKPAEVLEALRTPGLTRQLEERSPFEWLIGELRHGFKRHFHKAAGYTKGLNGGVKGAFIDFAAAVLRERLRERREATLLLGMVFVVRHALMHYSRHLTPLCGPQPMALMP